MLKLKSNLVPNRCKKLRDSFRGREEPVHFFLIICMTYSHALKENIFLQRDLTPIVYQILSKNHWKIIFSEHLTQLIEFYIFT